MCVRVGDQPRNGAVIRTQLARGIIYLGGKLRRGEAASLLISGTQARVEVADQDCLSAMPQT